MAKEEKDKAKYTYRKWYIAGNLYYMVVEPKEKKSPRLGVEPRSPALVLV